MKTSVLPAPVVGFEVRLVLEEGDALQLVDHETLVAAGATDIVEDFARSG